MKIPVFIDVTLCRRYLVTDVSAYRIACIFRAKQFKNSGIQICRNYRCADNSLARPTSRYIFFDGENISFDASLVIYINSTNIPPIMIISRIYEHQNLLSL